MKRKLRLYLGCAGENSTPTNPTCVSQFYHTTPRLTNLHKLFLGQKSNDSSPSKYKQIVEMFRYSGGYSEAETYLTHWGVSPIIKSLLLAYAEYDALSGGCDA
jgi:hypothetical protein